MCVFASFGGILFGYDSGYISGVLSMPFFITTITGLDQATTPPAQFVISASHQSLIVSILSAG
jgi:SP family sugar:H+ symporter-like MFS transporter